MPTGQAHVEEVPTEGRLLSYRTVIEAPAAEVFALLADPSRHAEIDGSNSVRGTIGTATPLTGVGDTFGMTMRIGLPYLIRNTVVEFEQDRLIAWRHLAGHRWRYALAPVDGGTEVTETFDWSTARVPKMIELAGYPKKHPPAMERTLERLEAVVTGAADGDPGATDQTSS